MKNNTYTPILMLVFALFTFGAMAQDTNTTNTPPSSFDDLVIWPNPSSGIYNVSFSSNESDVSIQIVDVRGRIIEERRVNPSSSQLYKTRVDISEFGTGVYLIILRSPDKKITKRLIKTKPKPEENK